MGEITASIPSEIPQLKDLDARLRCGICYEYMKTTMITVCSHNYCSMCIRQSLIYKAQCPTCFEEASDSQLRNNRIVDDIIEIFVTLLDEVRSFMQDYGKSSEPPKKLNEIPDLHQKSYNSDSKVKYNVGNKGIVNNVCSKNSETGAYRKLSECATGPAESSVVPRSEVELSDYSNFIRTQNMTPVKESHQSTDHRRKDCRAGVMIPAMFSPRKKLNVAEKCVCCPVCKCDIPEKNINVHLDVCLKRSEHFDQHTSPAKAQKRKPLPKYVYNLLQDKELRERLKQHGLSTHGDRRALINRHKRFTLLYNSENDNLNPRSTADIIKQLEREEQEEKKLSAATTSGNKLKIDVKTDPKLIEQAQLQYIQNNKASFEKLIQSMRDREAEKKTAAKRKLILSDDGSDSEDMNTEAQVQKVSGQKCTMEIRINTIDEEDTVEKGCGGMSPIIEDVSDNDEASDETIDMNYEADTDEALSPVLGRNRVTNCSRMETEKCYEGELSDSLTPDMPVKGTPRSSTKKCVSAAQQSKDDETDENSDAGSQQTISILSQHTQANVRTTHCILKVCHPRCVWINQGCETDIESSKTKTVPAIDMKLSRRRMRRGFNSQHDDPDFETYSEDTSDCCEFRASPVRKRRRNAKLSPHPSSSREERSLRKRGKN